MDKETRVVAWKRRALRWSGMSCLVVVLFMLLGTGAFLWLAGEYTRYHPLDLTDQLPKVAKYAMPEGVGLEADKVELFFDNGPVVRVSGLGVRGVDGNLGIFVEQAAIRLASTQFFLLSAAPKMVEASGVTLRLVRGVDGISVAGLNLPKNTNEKGVVEWLNGLGWDRSWGRIKTVRAANINLLVRDDIQGAEWVLERGNMSLERYPDEGERGTLTAVVRRLYGKSDQLEELDNVPVLVSFAHGPKADELIIRGRLDQANAKMVSDYFPPQFKDLLEAQGQVEIGTQVRAKNQIERPWVTLRLTDVKVQPPKGFSKGMVFPKLTVTASYVPPVEGVSESDVLAIRELVAVTERGAEVAVSGTVSGLQSDPLVDLSLASPAGEVQGIFDMFPDQERGFAKALHWLRPNIEKGNYSNLTAHYMGRPSAFPGCGDACGTLDIDARIDGGVVHFLKGMSPVKADNVAFLWRGQVMTVQAAQAKVASQSVGNVMVRMSDIFAVSPTVLRVTGNVKGDTHELIGELGRLEDTHGKVPKGISGRHASQIDITVPMPRGGEPTFAGSTVLVSSSMVGVKVRNLPQLKGLDFEAPAALLTMNAGKTLRVVGDGSLGGYPMNVDWSMNLMPKMPSMMRILAKGTVGGEWLMKQAPTELVSLTGPVGVSVNMRENADDRWVFAVNADAGKAAMAIEAAKFDKKAGERLAVEASGSYAPSESVVLEKLDVQGRDVSVGGAVRWDGDIATSVLDLPVVKFGATDMSVRMGSGALTVTGKRLDLRGYDLFGGGDSEKKKADGKPERMAAKINLAEVWLEDGKVRDVAAAARATKGRWDIETLDMALEGGEKVKLETMPLKGQGGRKKMVIAIQDLGKTLGVLGIYDKLHGGRMQGEITYDTPDVGGGLVKIEDFELKNPPVLVQLLSMLSLEQLLAGTNSTLFKTAVVPVRVDGGVWSLDNASLEGPSMSLRLDGTYNRTSKLLDIDGKMAPAIPLNRLVGKIPLLGGLLTGSQDGVLVADFKLKGSTDNPQINVRPLSVITPGLLKDFWRGLTGGSEKPKPQVIDGRSK